MDLDGAKAGQSQSNTANLAVIQTLVNELTMSVQTGGGIRSLNDVEQRLQLGVARVVIGSLCVQQPQVFADIVKAVGADRLVAALDARANEAGEFFVAAHGWLETSGKRLKEALDDLRGLGIQHVLCTDIDRDGMLSGPNVDLYASILDAHPGLQLQASGGVASESDLTALLAHQVPAVILGKSLLEGRFELSAALSLIQQSSTGVTA